MSIDRREFIYTLPESIFNDNSLVLTDYKVYMIVRSFMDSNSQCWASNKWFGEKLKVHPRTIQTSLTKLEEKGYLIRTEVNGVRMLFIKQNALCMKIDPEIDDGGGDLNTTGGAI